MTIESADLRVLVLGASGMLGNAVLRLFADSKGFTTVGTVRSARSARLLPSALQPLLLAGADVDNPDSLLEVFGRARPQVVINCIGLVKQLSAAKDPLSTIPINSLLPHRLARLCSVAGARLVHMSTDCVFSGEKGMYVESDSPDATDLYGRSKLLGEVDYDNAITLRTSIIGHELDAAHSLVGWFLAQQGSTKGFRRAIFSGLPTVEIARIIRDFVIPRPSAHGLYHVSAEAINKFDLLKLLADEYRKEIVVEPADDLVIDRSLDSRRFRAEFGYSPAPWPELVRRMRSFG